MKEGRLRRQQRTKKRKNKHARNVITGKTKGVRKRSKARS